MLTFIQILTKKNILQKKCILNERDLQWPLRAYFILLKNAFYNVNIHRIVYQNRIINESARKELS